MYYGTVLFKHTVCGIDGIVFYVLLWITTVILFPLPVQTSLSPLWTRDFWTTSVFIHVLDSRDGRYVAFVISWYTLIFQGHNPPSPICPVRNLLCLHLFSLSVCCHLYLRMGSSRCCLTKLAANSTSHYVYLTIFYTSFFADIHTHVHTHTHMHACTHTHTHTVWCRYQCMWLLSSHLLKEQGSSISS